MLQSSNHMVGSAGILPQPLAFSKSHLIKITGLYKKNNHKSQNILESHSVINTYPVYHYIVWKRLPGRGPSGFQAPIRSFQEWCQQYLASPFQASGVVELRDNTISCSEPLWKC